jgi:hypothetical protein
MVELVGFDVGVVVGGVVVGVDGGRVFRGMGL